MEVAVAVAVVQDVLQLLSVTTKKLIRIKLTLNIVLIISMQYNYTIRANAL